MLAIELHFNNLQLYKTWKHFSTSYRYFQKTPYVLRILLLFVKYHTSIRVKILCVTNDEVTVLCPVIYNLNIKVVQIFFCIFYYPFKILTRPVVNDFSVTYKRMYIINRTY